MAIHLTSQQSYTKHTDQQGTKVNSLIKKSIERKSCVLKTNLYGRFLKKPPKAFSYNMITFIRAGIKPQFTWGLLELYYGHGQAIQGIDFLIM